MDTDNQDYANQKYRRLIPARFQSASGVDTHDFRICSPWHRPYRYAEDTEGRLWKFDELAFCSFLIDFSLTPTVIPKGTLPTEFEAVILIGQLLWETRRSPKYITLHKAYECLAPTRDIQLSAIRHALTHPVSALNHPKTRQALIAIFGQAEIDFNKGKHVRLFYEVFGTLLIETDALLYDRLSSIVEKTYSVPRGTLLFSDPPELPARLLPALAP